MYAISQDMTCATKSTHYDDVSQRTEIVWRARNLTGLKSQGQCIM
jgi:hypothetical protein